MSYFYLLLILSFKLGDQVISMSDKDDKKLDEAAGGGMEVVKEKDPKYALPPPQKEVEIPQDFLSKLKGLSKAERRRTIFDLSTILDEADLIQEIEDERKAKLQSTMQEPGDDRKDEVSEQHSTVASAAPAQQSVTFTLDSSQISNASHTVHLQTSNPPRLKTFSGKDPVPNGEVDFNTWWMKAKPLTEDTEWTETQKRKSILDSLMKPALDMVKGQLTKPCADIMKILKNAYGDVRSARAQLNAFYNMYPEDGQEASSYLMDLHNALMELVGNGHMAVTEVSKELVNQFVEAFYDDSYSQKLNLSVDMSNPPTFGDLLLSIRTEEGRKRERKARLKMSNQQKEKDKSGKKTASSAHEARISSMQSTIDELNRKKDELSVAMAMQEKKLAAMQKQMGNVQQFSSSSENSSQPASTPSGSQSNGQQPADKSFPRFCYRCGKTGKHVASTCKGDPNPELVKKKQAERFAHLNSKGFQ